MYSFTAALILMSCLLWFGGLLTGQDMSGPAKLFIWSGLYMCSIVSSMMISFFHYTQELDHDLMGLIPIQFILSIGTPWSFFYFIQYMSIWYALGLTAAIYFVVTLAPAWIQDWGRNMSAENRASERNSINLNSKYKDVLNKKW